jgi:hypothetical protein
MRSRSLFATLSAAIALLSAGACASSPSGGTPPSSPTTAATVPAAQQTAARPADARIGLGAGWMNAAEATWNMAVVSKTQPSEKFFNPSTPGDRRLTNSDLAFQGNYVFQGNYSGYQVWDVSNPRQPTLRTAYVCRISVRQPTYDALLNKAWATPQEKPSSPEPDLIGPEG